MDADRKYFELKVKYEILLALLQAPIDYAESRPQGERGWKKWLAEVRKAIPKD